MNIAVERTVREIALEQPSSIRVFERFGIDYCCGGRKSLAQACEESQLSIDQVTEKLREASGVNDDEDLGQWQSASLAKLIQYIVRRHHTFVRQEIPRLRVLAEKVHARHGEHHVELKEVKELLDRASGDLTSHMLKEEQVLFPCIARMEHALAIGEELPPTFFGSVANPIQMMMAEHDRAGDLLRQIRQLTSNYLAPDGACPSYLGLLSGLHEFEQDLHRHVHLENNILFPRALKIEQENGGAERRTSVGGGCGLHG
jgi:regulator of cell morphogenesis and NO signaling